MAEVTLTPVVLSNNTPSASTPDAGGVVATSTTDGWGVTPAGSGTNNIVPSDPDKMIIRLLAPAGGDTVLIKKGVRPPSQLADKGDLSISLGANEVKFVTIEYGQFARANGSVQIVPASTSTKATVFQIARY